MKYWLYKLKRKSSPASAPSATRFIPITVADDAKEPPLVLRVGLTRIELHAGFDPELLREVVQALTGDHMLTLSGAQRV